MNENEKDQQNPCTCVIDNWPATTSIARCPEHGMPTSLQETEWPGSVPKYAIFFVSQFKKPGLIAPLYTPSEIEQAFARLEALKAEANKQPVLIYSLADLERVTSGRGGFGESSRAHEPGCIYSAFEHPGNCYVGESL